MSYEPANSIQPTPGLAFEAFQAGVRSPMFYHAPYRPQAAGPGFLTPNGLSGPTTSYWAAQATVPGNLRGFGLDPSSIVSQYVEPYLDNVVQGVINRNWPTFQQKLDASLSPLKILLGLTVVASGAAAVIGYMNYARKP